jgi:hypothetical protein
LNLTPEKENALIADAKTFYNETSIENKPIFEFFQE